MKENPEDPPYQEAGRIWFHLIHEMKQRVLINDPGQLPEKLDLPDTLPNPISGYDQDHKVQTFIAGINEAVHPVQEFQGNPLPSTVRWPTDSDSPAVVKPHRR